MKLQGKVAAITGGTAGIGRGIAEAFLAEGASVALMARNEEKAQAVLAELDVGNRAVFIAGDATVQADIEGFVDKAAAHFGKLDILVNNAGGASGLLTGMRAISVAISERSAVSGFILPNDRVDVILTRKLDGPSGGGSNKIVRSETVLSNVRVLAINQTFRQEAGEDKVTVTEGKTAVLELDPLQSEVITKVEAAGELSLALRSIAEGGDMGVQDTRPVLSEAFSGKKKSADGERMIVRYGVETVITNR